MIKETAQALGMVEPDVRLVSDEPNWIEGSSKGHRTWRVQLSSTPAQAEQILSSLRTKLDSTPVWLSANQIGSAVAGDKTRLARRGRLGQPDWDHCLHLDSLPACHVRLGGRGGLGSRRHALRSARSRPATG